MPPNDPNQTNADFVTEEPAFVDDGAGFSESAEEIALRDALEPQIAAMDAADDGLEDVFAPQHVTENLDRISEEEGLAKVADKYEPKAASAKPEEPEAPKGDQEETSEADGVSADDAAADDADASKASGSEAEGEDEGSSAANTDEDVAGASFGLDSDVMAAIPEEHRETITKLATSADQYAQVEEAMAPFADQLKNVGGSTVDGIRTLAQLSDFASRDPVAYGGWFLSQVAAPEQQAEMLQKIGSALGVQLTPEAAKANDDPDDLFGDDDDDAAKDTQAQPADTRIDVEARRRASNVDNFLASFANAKGPDGEDAHPYFKPDNSLSSSVLSAMNASIKADIAAEKITKPPETIADLRPYYLRAAEFVTGKPQGGSKPAAQPGAAPASTETKKAAAAKAKRASTPLEPGSQAAPSQGNAADEANVLQGVDPTDLSALLDAQMKGAQFVN